MPDIEVVTNDGRRKLAPDRRSITHKAHLNGITLYITAGLYDDGTLGEVFWKGGGKHGSTMQGLMDAYSTMFSIALQYGTPFDVVARKFVGVRFEPEGATDNDEIPTARSMIDYMMRWLVLRFGSEELRLELL